MHDAVTIVLGAKRELERVPGVVNPLVGQHVKVVNTDMLVPEMRVCGGHRNLWRMTNLSFLV